MRGVSRRRCGFTPTSRQRSHPPSLDKHQLTPCLFPSVIPLYKPKEMNSLRSHGFYLVSQNFCRCVRICQRKQQRNSINPAIEFANVNELIGFLIRTNPWSKLKHVPEGRCVLTLPGPLIHCICVSKSPISDSSAGTKPRRCRWIYLSLSVYCRRHHNGVYWLHNVHKDTYSLKPQR